MISYADYHILINVTAIVFFIVGYVLGRSK